MKALIINDDFAAVETLRFQESGDWEYPYNIVMNDGFGKSDVSFTKAEAEAMRDWLVAVLSPLENK
jgi:hypothetical protein